MFIIKNPGSKYVKESRELINELNEKLVEKSYISARLYFDLGKYKSSIVALTNSLTEYPDTKYREDIKFMILNSHYLLADNSVPQKKKERFQDTLDEYYSFIGEFPESRYNKEVEKLHEVTTSFLGIKKEEQALNN